MSVNTFENKKLLWSILQDNGCFKGLPDYTFSEVKEQFENFVIQNDKGLMSLVNKNKRVINMMVNHINKVKKNNPIQDPTQDPTQDSTQDSTQDPTQDSYLINKSHTREDLQQQRQVMFEDRLKKRQKEFTSLIEKNRPKEIDFSDKDDNSYNNIVKESEQFVIQREKDLNILPEKSNQEIQKLKIDNSIVGNKTAKEVTEKIVIDINSPIEISNNTENKSITKQEINNKQEINKKPKKNVRFNDSKHTIDDSVSLQHENYIDSSNDQERNNQEKNKKKLRSPPPALSVITTDNTQPENKLTEILTVLKNLESKVENLEKKNIYLHNEIEYIKSNLNNNIGDDYDSLSKNVEFTKDIYD